MGKRDLHMNRQHPKRQQTIYSSHCLQKQHKNLLIYKYGVTYLIVYFAQTCSSGLSVRLWACRHCFNLFLSLVFKSLPWSKLFSLCTKVYSTMNKMSRKPNLLKTAGNFHN